MDTCWSPISQVEKKFDPKKEEEESVRYEELKARQPEEGVILGFLVVKVGAAEGSARHC